LIPDIIRSDAQRNIEALADLSPTPWTFRNRRGHSFTPTDAGADASWPVSEPPWDVLFSNNGPFVAARSGFHPDWPLLPLVPIRLFPTAVPWEVFAYQPFGGWNDAPWPDEVLVMFRHWYDRHGAEVVSVGADWLEVFVPRPPRSRDEAGRLIDELGWFGEESPMRFAPGNTDPLEYIGAQHYWYFWWD
jgi:hypothetical protein